MNDMSQVIIPRSDQINAETLLSGPQTFTIKEVQIKAGEEQPVSIYLEETNLAFRPCKSVSRVLVHGWGPDAKKYIGRSLTLYRDPKVKWGGLEVGGIRVSHLSHIGEPLKVVLSESRAVRKPVTIMPLTAEVRQIADDAATKWARGYIAKISTTADLNALNAFANEKAVKLAELESKRPELHTECIHALNLKREALSIEPEGPADDQRGEDFTEDAFEAD